MLSSLRAVTSQPYDLLVFDNGSCEAVASELKSLHAQGEVEWLVLSQHNIGKAGAWNWIFSAMPNELIAYADSDVLFRPGWLEASQQVLQTFPRAGMVSAQPNFYDVMDGQGTAHKALHGDARFAFEDYYPSREIVDEFCLGIGATDEVAAPFYQRALPAITHRQLDLGAVIGASHMQFIIPREVARQVVPLPATMGLRRAETMSLDKKVDELGYLHLSTQKPYVFHMGNTLNHRLMDEVRQVIRENAPRSRMTPGAAGRDSPLRGLVTRLVRHPRFNKQFLRLYNFLFQALHSHD
jgi:glycosyltransferase involved in cell wall biosynthesis